MPFLVAYRYLDCLSGTSSNVPELLSNHNYLSVIEKLNRFSKPRE